MPARELTPEFITANETCGPAMLLLSQPHRCFVICIVEFGNSQADAARRAGFSNKGDNAKSTGHRLAHDPRIQAALTEVTLSMIRTHGAQSVRTLIALRDNAKDEKVKLRAATELLDRCGGLSSTSQHQIVVRREYTMAELDLRRIALERELGLLPALPDPNIIDADFSEVDPDIADLI